MNFCRILASLFSALHAKELLIQQALPLSPFSSASGISWAEWKSALVYQKNILEILGEFLCLS